MSLTFTLLTVAELLVGLFLIWGFWHEDKMVAFEDRLFERLGIARHKKSTAKITRFDSAAQSRPGKRCI